MNILIGIVYQQKYPSGSITFTRNVIDQLKMHCNVHLLMLPDWVDSGPQETLAEEMEWNGFQALVLRPKTALAYNLQSTLEPDENISESNVLSNRIQQYITDKKINLIHVIEWERLKGVFLMQQ